ncbi:MAG TPA: LuxR C-terminal-related transcriptional regulator, partial [Polyangia bacterium]|nr:LuxR C-terminal-related transcriptional regulator [Polyangia bacterium]
TPRETRILRALIGPLRERLRLEQRLRTPPGLAAALLETALEEIPGAAFVVGPSFQVELANRAGVRALERDRPAVLEALRASARGGVAAGFRITRLAAPGWPPYLLAIEARPDPVIGRVLRAQQAWGLSTRQARVLELLATGASNKEIAAALACAEATVETHVTELFRRSGTTSRAGLVGKLLALT